MKIKLYRDPSVVAYEKAIKIIDSCKSLDQLECAKRYCDLYFMNVVPKIESNNFGHSFVLHTDLCERLINKQKQLL